MDSDFYKSPWFLTLVGIALWSCGYITADDNRIEHENKTPSYRQASKIQDRHPALPRCDWQDIAQNRHTP